MNRIQIFAVSALLLFLGAASVASAAVSRSSISPTFPIQQPPSPRTPNPASCSLPDPAPYKADPVEVEVPSDREAPSFDPEEVPDVLPKPDRNSSKYYPLGKLDDLRGYYKSTWTGFEKFVRSDIPREATRSEARRVKSQFRSGSRKVSSLVKKINKNEKSYSDDYRKYGESAGLAAVTNDYNAKGTEKTKEGVEDFKKKTAQYWAPGRPIYNDAAAANQEIKKAVAAINKARRDKVSIQVEACQEVQELEYDRDYEVERVWKKGDNDYRVLTTRATNEIATIDRRVRTEVALEEVTAQEEIENTNAEADAEIIRIIEQYEGDKIDETNATNDEITSLTLTAEDDQKVERDTAQDDIQDATATTNEEVALIESDASDQITEVRSETNGRLSDLQLEFRDARSGLDDALQTSLDNVRARWSPKIEALRNRIEEAEQVLRKRPGANWPARLRRQLLQAQRKAERVFASSKNAIRASKVKRDAQLAAARRNYNQKIAKSKKAELARRTQIEREYQETISPIREGADREKRTLQSALQSQIRVIEEKRDENIAVIDTRLKAQVAGLTKTLSELLLRLDRQKSNEAGSVDKQRDLAVLQRERAKTRVVAELRSAGDSEKADAVNLFDEEASALVDEVSSEMRDIKKSSASEISATSKTVKSELEGLDEVITDSEDDIDTAKRDFQGDYIEAEDSWNEDLDEIEDDVKEALKDFAEDFRDAERETKSSWKRTGDNASGLESFRRAIADANKKSFDRVNDRGKKEIRDMKTKKK